MKTNFFDTILGSGNDSMYESARHARIVLLAGIFTYSIYGILDWFMLPQTYHTAWIIRFFIIAPASILSYLFTFTKMKKYNQLWLFLIVVLGQLGIVYMIYNASPSEGGYWSYYAGLIIINLWAVTMLRLSVPAVVIVSAINVVFYNIVAIGFQKIYQNPDNSVEFSYLINNNFFLITTAMLAVIGSYQMNLYKKKILAHNLQLSLEKKELFKAKKKAEESDQLKSAFLANMSHEIRTPMNAILGFSELIKNPSLPEDKRKSYINIIQSKGSQLMHLINDIIDISKIETNNMTIIPEPLQLNQLFDELALTCKRTLHNENKDKSIKLWFNKTLDNDWVMADSFRLKQVLSNLLDNAIKFTTKGNIIVGYELIEGDVLQFYVKDTGIGIPVEKQSVIFERFRQVSDSEYLSGTGLGLSIVKSLVELAGGTIWVKSEPNQGSEFYFTMPFQPAKKPQAPIPVFDTAYIDWHGKTILIAEDEDDNYMFLEELLIETGVTIIRAINGKEAVEIALGPQTIDLILMDIKMPGTNGYEATRQIKRAKNYIPVIAQTAYAMEGDRNKALAALCDDYVAKPIEPDQLIRKMKKFLI